MVENFSEWFHDILEEANITDSRYPIKGMAVWMPYGFQIRKYTTNLIKEVYQEDFGTTRIYYDKKGCE